MTETPQAYAPLQLMSAREVCERLSISLATLHRWVRAGRFPTGHQMGPNTVRWFAADVAAWLAARAGVTVTGGGPSAAPPAAAAHP